MRELDVERLAGRMKVKLERITTEAHPRAVHAERDWPTVPRVGEYVEIVVDGEIVTGTVRAVLWNDDGVPLVKFR
jgi:hypothetical protein